MEFVMTMRYVLYCIIVLLGVCSFASGMFRIVDAIERPAKRKARRGRR